MMIKKKMKDLKVGDYIYFNENIDVREYLGVVTKYGEPTMKLQSSLDEERDNLCYNPEDEIHVLDIKHNFGDIVKDKVSGITIKIHTIYITSICPLQIVYQDKNFKKRMYAKDACIIRPRDETVFECIMRRLDIIETRLNKLEH